MISWDIVMMLGQAFLTLFLLPTALAFDVSLRKHTPCSEGCLQCQENYMLGPDKYGLFFSRKHGVYVPRLTSGSTTIGLSVIAVALFGLGAPIGAATAALCVVLWGVVFVFRGTAPREA